MDYRKALESKLSYDMPKGLKNNIKNFLKDQSKTDDEIKMFYREVNKRKVLIKAREEIDWYPRIEEGLCVDCKICYDFCPKGVYELVNGKVVVTNPYDCVFSCTGCVNKCLRGAIDFPKKKDYKHFIKYL